MADELERGENRTRTPSRRKTAATRWRGSGSAEMERRSGGPWASGAVGRRPPSNNSGRGLKKSVIADPLRADVERVAQYLSGRHEIGPPFIAVPRCRAPVRTCPRSLRAAALTPN